MSLYAHYDPDADIVLVRVEDGGDHVVSEETEFGLKDIDRRSGRIVGLELWDASRRLPGELLELLPPPAAPARA